MDQSPTIVAIVAATHPGERAVVLLRADGAYELRFQRLHQEVVPDVGPVGEPGWIDSTHGKSLFDTKERAEDEARRALLLAR